MRRTSSRTWRPTIAACLALTAIGLLVPVARAAAEVTRVDVIRRADVGTSGYEKIVGTIHFALDPAHPRNAVIVDLDRAAPGADRRVSFSADLYILRPKDPARSNGAALIEVANRGNKGLLSYFGLATRGGLDPSSDADLGDGFLTREGYTLVWVGWQFDVDRAGGRVKLDPPVAAGTSGLVRANFTLDAPAETAPLTDLAGYTLDATGPDAVLTVRDGVFGRPETIPRANWTLRGRDVTLQGGFVPGRMYEVTARAIDLPIAGTGLAAFRDTATWLKHVPGSLAPVKYAYAFGASQSGRFLRTFLYYGFNSDEAGRQVFDGVMAHIAGGARLSINERGARPNQSKAPSPGFPFADAALRDPISGRVDGLLDNDRARLNQPRVFYTNSAVEYWGSDRLAALVHTTPDGAKDITPPANVRVYFLTGTQHVPASFPPAMGAGQQLANPVIYGHTLRALLTAMQRWVQQGTAPPPSRHPTLADGTLVRVSDLRFPRIPGVQAPHTLPPAREGAATLPFLVPAVDADGNERAGVRTAEIAVPVATYTGWNFRHPKIGGTGTLASLLGSTIPFAATRATRTSGDSRRAIAERYESKARYLALAQAHCDTLVAGGYLLATDVPLVLKRMADHWNRVVGTN